MKIAEYSQLVRAAQNGDTGAQQELYIESSKHVYYLALKIVHNENDAEDIMQDVFITVFDKLPALKQPAAYPKWVSQITAHRCASFLRQKRAVPGEEQDILDILDLEEDENSPTPERLYDDEETRRLILEIVDNLPDAQRMCILYRYFNQFSIKEIADITETNEFTVKSRLALARKKLRNAILAKEEKEGIRLHVIIPIMPILMRALDEFTMPEGLTERMWTRISEGAGIAASGGAVATAASTGGADAPTQPPAPQAEPSAADGHAPNTPDTPGPGEQPQTNPPKGENNMNHPNSNNPWQQPPQQPQSNVQPGQPPQPHYNPPQNWQPQGQPQGIPGTPPGAPPGAPPTGYTPPPPPPAPGFVPPVAQAAQAAQTAANTAAQVAGMAAAKAGMALGVKIAIAAASVAGLAVGGAFLLPQLLDGGDGANAGAQNGDTVYTACVCKLLGISLCLWMTNPLPSPASNAWRFLPI